jgi:formylmethanofuran dehydrogenase subunit E
MLTMKPFFELLEASAALHHHLCPRQVLGVRMGMLAGDVLGLELPQAPDSKRLLTIVETDGCFSDGVAVATHCWVGRRTLRVEDYGKVAATFVDTHTGQAVRILPRGEARQLARAFATEARNRWETQLLGYQRMPASELLITQQVQLKTPIEQLLSRPGVKVRCEMCGEEILNERQVVHEGTTLCRPCAGQAYYQSAPTTMPAAVRLSIPMEAV